jgi:hypothetical protein
MHQLWTRNNSEAPTMSSAAVSPTFFCTHTQRQFWLTNLIMRGWRIILPIPAYPHHSLQTLLHAAQQTGKFEARKYLLSCHVSFYSLSLYCLEKLYRSTKYPPAKQSTYQTISFQLYTLNHSSELINL